MIDAILKFTHEGSEYGVRDLTEDEIERLRRGEIVTICAIQPGATAYDIPSGTTVHVDLRLTPIV